MHLFSSTNPNRQHQQTFQSKWFILLASLFTVPFLFHLFSAKFADPKSLAALFGIIINAGPTGSLIRVFKFLGEGQIPLMDGSGSSSMKVRLGLDQKTDSISRLIAFAKRLVPKKDRRNTKIQLMDGAHFPSLFSLQPNIAVVFLDLDVGGSNGCGGLRDEFDRIIWSLIWIIKGVICFEV